MTQPPGHPQRKRLATFQWTSLGANRKISKSICFSLPSPPVVVAVGSQSVVAMRRFIRSRFARQESVHDYAGVLVPLEEAHLHSYSARCGKAEFEERRRGSGDDDVGVDNDDYNANAAGPNYHYDEDEETALGTAYKSGDHEGEGMLQMDAAEYTIEGLRRDARKGEPGRRWTEYECEFCISFSNYLPTHLLS